ncbi:MAG TPA: tyrosine-protein phosphatase [Acidimicrobiales bacterium]
MSDPQHVAAPDHPDRKLPFTGALNFRDLGGYRGRAGQTVRWRTLYRAAALHRLPDDELDQLAVMGVRSVLDLRTSSEVDHGRIQADHLGIVHLHLPFLPDIWNRDELDPDAEPDQVLGALYVQMLSVGAPAIAEALRTLADPANVPAVFHCTAGKDRTGVLAALVLALLGVDEDTIVGDYELTSGAMRELAERIRRNNPELLSAMSDQPPAYLMSPPGAMRVFLDHVRVEHGSMVGYVRGIGVELEVVEALNANLLA